MTFKNICQNKIEMKLTKDGLMYKTKVEIEIWIPVQIFWFVNRYVVPGSGLWEVPHTPAESGDQKQSKGEILSWFANAIPAERTRSVTKIWLVTWAHAVLWHDWGHRLFVISGANLYPGGSLYPRGVDTTVFVFVFCWARVLKWPWNQV